MKHYHYHIEAEGLSGWVRDSVPFTSRKAAEKFMQEHDMREPTETDTGYRVVKVDASKTCGAAHSNV